MPLQSLSQTKILVSYIILIQNKHIEIEFSQLYRLKTNTPKLKIYNFHNFKSRFNNHTM